jgi:error-prone DNA polymerase
MYVELHARSAFSFLEGASVPEELVVRCTELNMPAMALLDRDGVYGAPRFHMAAKKAGIRAHVGAEVTATDGSRYTLLVETRAGYQNLCRLITRMKLRASKGQGAVTPEEMAEHAGGLVCLTGGEEGPLAVGVRDSGFGVRETGNWKLETGNWKLEARQSKVQNLKSKIERLCEIFGRRNVYVELQRHLHRDEEARNQAAVELARELRLPLLATNGVCYATPPQREILDVFTCIRNHRILDTAGRLLARNSERYLKPSEEMARLFADLPEAIANTQELSARLQFTLNDLGYEFPKYPTPQGETQMEFLRARTWEGALNRYGQSRQSGIWPRARQQVERELVLIEKLKLPGYFLIVWDMVRYCREQNILVQGRGSAANSAVCYSLGITAVDPVGMELLFERFLSEERGEWPDIDLDLPSGEQRERAIQYVYQRYGKLGAAMTANVITYRGRSAAREVGKVLGFDAETLDRLAHLVSAWEYRDAKDTLERQFRDAGVDLAHPRMRKFLELCLAVQDLPRHLGQHSGGMVVCQGQLDSVVPLEPATMPGRVVVQWDKEDCADMGIIKIDLLGLGMMAVLEDSLKLIREGYREEVDLACLPPDDPEVYRALQRADTVGMFQVESRAQMSCLPRLRPQRFYDLVVEVAIIRPGPIVGNMVHPYLKRRQGREPVTYPHPSLEPVLKRTLGVPLFQEQLLRMAMIVADFTGGEAEELRRAMGFKRSEARMKEIETKLRAGMEHKGITGAAQDQIVQSITSFALYGFPESHAASFALLAYASAYLKCHYLAAFTAALLNNQPMGFYHPATIVKDAQRHGLKVKPIDVTRSHWLCTLEVAPRYDGGWPLTHPGKPGHPLPQGEGQNPTIYPEPDSLSKGEGKPPTQPFSPFPEGEGLGVRGSTTGPKLRRSGSELCVRLGMRYVKGLREQTAQAIVQERAPGPFLSIDDLTRRVPVMRKMEATMLAEVGALNFVGAGSTGVLSTCGQDPDTSGRVGRAPRQMHRRDALWQVERAARPAGPLFDVGAGLVPVPPAREHPQGVPLQAMTPEERLVADFRGTGMTVGPHPMAYRRAEMKVLGVRTASELCRIPNGRRVRIAGCVIARQRPGTAKGFVFLSLEDETGIANAIIVPDLFDSNRVTVAREPFLLIEGHLQQQDGVTSVKAERVVPLDVTRAETRSHDFH